ncbi:GerMN domain-containing protein [Patescibacteria group bacterium]|nr:GerMN domain-containing protein [Patescibacteria group bacterium]MBU4367291.1 GerMN domain-containing protein [Patescibacteria group bacterium]MBU4461992.1 GerMN domain-containing protein [Patescibacteria group bacterium]MCG2700183.1 GerMN domain-containing protein [Candidatus Parcubacteria bacterium]
MNNTTKKIIIIILFFVVILTGIGFWIFNEGKSEPEPVLQTGVVVTSPETNEEVSFPLKITGYVNGDGWTGFEGQVGTVKLLRQDGFSAKKVILTATTDWMTSPVYFEQYLTTVMIDPGEATLVFQNENPSGLAENDREFRLPVKISPLNKIKVYFNNNKMDPEFSCNKVFAVERTVSQNFQQLIYGEAIKELLKGPTEEEKAQGFFSSINPGIGYREIIIGDDNIVRIDFNEKLEEAVGGSCRVAAIRAEITQTLKQFPTIENVIISINGRTEDILQP